ncbi:hypothetical protein GYMLUDRAFT_41307 [Collybiopsis luxurians FD-317 M1]|uniref:Uncharacterized protein n=1 Tax=Collybiopsis luxurians FD-317 M1 TaxID=944289 RepID=A0A0D0C4H2_9AGAR|nr:hypothetical protein GYMLUDRAFT_41307 [Collybiopsis luxurians FD-317 M1]
MQAPIPEQSPRMADMGGLVIVVDSSVALATILPSVMQNYFTQVGRKVFEASPGANYRIGWVTYGQADCPILAKRFFAEYPLVMTALKDSADFSNLGIGTTTAGGTKGMAALEGLVAAVELFDTLAEIKPPKWPSHILHITASFPDNSKHPRENIFPSLDYTTWETLPNELAKRNIFLSSVVLNPKKSTKISELHASPLMNTAPTPWLTALPTHAVYVPLLIPTQKGVKRSAEPMNHIEQPPEKKHQPNVPSAGSPPRPQPTTTPTPSVAGPAPSAQPLTQTASTGSSGAPPQQSVPAPPQIMPNPSAGSNSANVSPLPFPIPPLNSSQRYPWPGLGSFTPTELLSRVKFVEETKKKTDAGLQSALKELKELKDEMETKGEKKEAEMARAVSKVEAFKAELMKMEPILTRFRAVASGYLALLRKMQVGTNTAGGQTTNNNGSTSTPAAPVQIQPSASGDSSSSDLVPPSNANISSTSSPSGPAAAPTSTISASSPHTAVKSSPKPSPSLTATFKQSPKPSPKLLNKANPSQMSPKTTPKSNAKSSPVRNPAASTSTPPAPPMGSGSVAPNAGSGPLGMNMSPEVAIQMQKLWERGVEHSKDMAKGQSSPSLGAATLGGGGIPPHPQTQQPGSGMHIPEGTNSNTISNMGVSGQPGQQIPGTGAEMPNQSVPNGPNPPQNAGTGGIPAWTGTLFLPADPKSGRKDVRIPVTANSANTTECRVHTWPTEMTLAVTNQPVVSPNEFSLWARKTRPVVCTMKASVRVLSPAAGVANPQAQIHMNKVNMANEQIFRAFSNMVNAGKTYIVSSWTLPSGKQSPNVVFSVQHPHGLIGAFFPVNGIPEMPSPMPALSAPGASELSNPNPNTSSASGHNPVLAALQAMNVPREFMSKILMMPPQMQAQAVKALLMKHRQGQQAGMPGAGLGGALAQLGIAGRPGSGSPSQGTGVNITNAAAAMAMRMSQQQAGAPGSSSGGTGLPLNLQNLQAMQGFQQPSGQLGHLGQMDGHQPHSQQQQSNPNLNPNIASLINGMKAKLGNAGNLGNLGGMGGMNAASLGGMGGGVGGMTPQQMQQMQHFQQQLQNRGAFGGGGLGQGGGGMG